MPHPLFRFLHLAAAEGVADAELLRRFAEQRDEAAFELLVRRHADLVWKVCRGVLRQDADAEDAFQATFLALAKKAGAVRAGGTLGGWLHRVAVHAALKLRAKAARVSTADLSHLPAARESDAAAILHEELARLGDPYRLPVLLCDLEGHTHAEAARLLGWPVGTVSGRLNRAREQLRRRLERRGVLVAGVAVAVGQAAPGLVRAAVGLGNGTSTPSPAVASLTSGVLSAMRTVNRKLIAAAALLVGLSGGGTLLAVGGAGGDAPKAEPPKAARPAAKEQKPATDQHVAGPLERARSQRDLQQVAAAILGYLVEHSELPTDILDPKTKKPLLSWRVAILPYMEQRALYKLFKLDEPWDSPANKQAASVWIKLYSATASPQKGVPYGMTRVKRFTGPNTLHQPGQPIDGRIPDGRANTILLAEVGDPVPWAKPDDPVVAVTLPPTIKNPTVWRGPYSNVVNIALANGRAVSLKPNLPAQVIASLICPNDALVLPKWSELVAAPTREQDAADLMRLVKLNRKLAEDLARLTEEEAKLEIELARQGKGRADLSTPAAVRFLQLSDEARELRNRNVGLRKLVEKGKK
jgi:RNA polymerase sigma factor (sigma-70 family)